MCVHTRRQSGKPGQRDCGSVCVYVRLLLQRLFCCLPSGTSLQAPLPAAAHPCRPIPAGAPSLQAPLPAGAHMSHCRLRLRHPCVLGLRLCAGALCLNGRV